MKKKNSLKNNSLLCPNRTKNHHRKQSDKPKTNLRYRNLGEIEKEQLIEERPRN